MPDFPLQALTPERDHGWALMLMGCAYEQKGMFQEALSALQKAFPGTLRAASIAHAFAVAGNRPAAEKILEELLADSKKKYVSPYDIAVTYAGLDDKEQVLRVAKSGLRGTPGVYGLYELGPAA